MSSRYYNIIAHDFPISTSIVQREREREYITTSTGGERFFIYKYTGWQFIRERIKNNREHCKGQEAAAITNDLLLHACTQTNII